MSVCSDDCPTLPEYSDSREPANRATITPAASSARNAFADIPTINRHRYARAFRRVRYWEGASYFGDGSKELLGIYKNEIKSLEPEGPFGATSFAGVWVEIFGIRERETPLLGNFVSIEKATVQLEQALYSAERIPRSSNDAIKRLQHMIGLGDKEIWGPELVAKSFHDWDRVFFNGRLKGHTRLQWKSEADYGMEHDLGVQRNVDMGFRWARVKIELNADRILLDPTPYSMREGEAPVTSFRMMFGVLLHEMTHAYLAILTGNGEDEDEEEEGFDGTHGRHFQRCIYAVDKMSRALLGIAACNDSTPSSDGRLRRPFDVEAHSVKRPRSLPWHLHKKPPRMGKEFRRMVKKG